MGGGGIASPDASSSPLSRVSLDPSLTQPPSLTPSYESSELLSTCVRSTGVFSRNDRRQLKTILLLRLVGRGGGFRSQACTTGKGCDSTWRRWSRGRVSASSMSYASARRSSNAKRKRRRVWESCQTFFSIERQLHHNSLRDSPRPAVD